MAVCTLGRFVSIEKKKCEPCSTTMPLSGTGFTGSNSSMKITNLEEFITTVNKNPLMIRLTGIIQVWRGLGAKDDLIVQMIESTPCFGTLVTKSIARGFPTDGTLSAIERLSQRAFEFVINYIKQKGVQYCQELIGKLARQFVNVTGVGDVLAFISKKAGRIICQELIDLLDREIFRRYVVPFLNCLFQAEIISDQVGGPRFFGSTDQEKNEITNCFDTLNAKTASIRNLITDGGGNPDMPPLPNDGNDNGGGGIDFGAGDNDGEDSGLGKKVLIGSSVAVALAVGIRVYNNKKSQS